VRGALPLADVPRLVTATGIASAGALALLFALFYRSRRGLAFYGGLALGVAFEVASPLLPVLHLRVSTAALGRLSLALAFALPALAHLFLFGFLNLSRPVARRVFATAPLALGALSMAGIFQDSFRSAAGVSLLLLAGDFFWVLVRDERRHRRDTAIVFAAVLLLILGAVADVFSARQVLLARPPAIPFLAPAFAGFTLLLLTAMAAEDRLLFARAITDSLTNLPNRTAFLERARREVARAERTGRTLAVVMLDIDHFKSFNDRYGHHTGDRVLAAVGQAIAQTIRGIDIAGRYGGEEFVVLLVEADRAAAGPAVERIREAVSNLEPPRVPEKITTSAGIAIHRGLFERARIDGLIRRADAALYEAKRAGRDRACFERAATPAARSAAEVTYR
jgi:diguanylate cyclase (GGDEF)-like protein